MSGSLVSFPGRLFAQANPRLTCSGNTAARCAEFPRSKTFPLKEQPNIESRLISAKRTLESLKLLCVNRTGLILENRGHFADQIRRVSMIPAVVPT